MTIESTLERMAVALETIAASQLLARPATSAPKAEAPAAPAPAPAAPAPANTLPFPGPAAAAPPPPPPASPSLPSASLPAGSSANLDDIRAKANDFHRAHPDRAAEVVAILAAAGAQKMTEIPTNQYANVLAQLIALGA